MKKSGFTSWFILLVVTVLAGIITAVSYTASIAAFVEQPLTSSDAPVFLATTALNENVIDYTNLLHDIYLPLVQAADPDAGNVFYVSPNGNDGNAGTSAATAWATFNRAWQDVYPGDTLILLDGVYYQSLNPNRRNGEPGKPITIRSLNDGQAIIDGEYQRVPVKLGDTWPGPIGNWFLIEGIVAKNGDNQLKWSKSQQRWYLECNGSVWCIQGHNNILRRISGYNASIDGNSRVINLGGTHNLVEDCVAAGSGRKMILSSFSSSNNIIRRCFAGWQEWRGGEFCPGHIPWGENIETYNSSHNIIENSIGYGRTPRPGGGINVFAQASSSAIGNKVLGSIVMNVGMNWDGTDILWPCSYPGSSCTTCWDPEWLNHRSGFRLGSPNTSGDVTNNLFQDIFSYGNAGLGLSASIPSTSYGQNQLIRATLINNGIGEGIRAEGCNNPDDTRCEKDRNIQLNMLDAFNVFDENKIECTPAQEPHCTGNDFNGEGARIQYQYYSYFDADNNPVTTLTNIPLWPWPMEDRIREEFNTHLSMYHAQTPELINFSVTSTITPILAQYGALDEPVSVNSQEPSTIMPVFQATINSPFPLICELDIP